MTRSSARTPLLWLAILSLAACSGGVTSTDTTTLATASVFTVGGTVTGLTGSNLTLQNNGGDNLGVAANGSFTFATPLIRGDSYSVTVLLEPTTPAQTCVVTNGSGTVGTANVSSVAVVCADKTTTTDTIGGTAVGVLGSGLVLQDNKGDNLAVASDGPFTFATALPVGAAYSVSVLTPPINPYQDCVVANAAGTTAGSDVKNIAVSCKTNANTAYTIGGSVSGITGTGSLVLQDNGRDNLTVSADGPFQFAIPIPSGSTYNVTSLQVNGQQSQTCTFTNASGTVAASNVTNVTVACTANALVSVTVSGLSGTGLVLQDNGADNLAITGNGPATFATAVPSGSTYNVTVLSEPATQDCVVTNGTGTAVAGQATPVTVACTTVGFTVGGTITGLSGTGLVLQDNGGDNLPVTGLGSLPFTFATALPSGGAYSVSVLTQPATPYQTCTVSNGTGAIQAGNITNVAIDCATNSYTVGGVVSGLPTDPTTGAPYTGLSLQLNGGGAYAITNNGAFTLPGSVDSGAAYNVTIAGEPTVTPIACAVASGSGTIANAAVTNVAVTCIQTGGYLYVTNGGGNDISGFAIDYNSGVLSPLSNIVAPQGQPNAVIATTDTHPSSLISSTMGSSCVLAYSPAGNDYPLGLYVANSVSGTVSAYSMDTNTITSLGGGALTPITSPSVAAGTSPGYIDFDAVDCAVFALNSGSSNISAYSAPPPSGVPTPVTGSPFTLVGAGPVPVAAVSTTGVGPNLKNFEYVASQVTNDVSAYQVASDGTLTLAASLVPPTANPVAAGTTPSAAVADVLTTNVAGANFPVQYIFVANQGDNTISPFKGDANTGLLTPLASVATGNGPTAMAMVRFLAAPQFDLLYVANGADNTISAYSVSTALPSPGGVTPLGVVATTGTHPVAMTYAFVGVNSIPFLYVVNDQSNDLYVYQITTAVGGVPAYGALTLIGKYAVGTAPTSVTVPYTQFGG